MFRMFEKFEKFAMFEKFAKFRMFAMFGIGARSAYSILLVEAAFLVKAGRHNPNDLLVLDHSSASAGV